MMTKTRRQKTQDFDRPPRERETLPVITRLHLTVLRWRLRRAYFKECVIQKRPRASSGPGIEGRRKKLEGKI